MDIQNAPSKDILNAFAIKGNPVLLEGGRGVAWRAGEYVIKPVDNVEETAWCAEVIKNLSQDLYRIPKYKKTEDNEWTYNGWFVLEFIKGEHLKNHWEEKLNVCRGFNKLLINIPKPNFIEKRTDPWSVASKMAWGEMSLDFVSGFNSYVDKINKYLKPITVKNQIAHGDITGNMLFSGELQPGIIDFTPIWRPREYSLAILIVDALAWEGADEIIIDLVINEQNIFQLLLRAALFRALAASEYFRENNLDRPLEIAEHERTLDVILNHFLF